MPLDHPNKLVLRKLKDCFPNDEDAQKALDLLNQYGKLSYHNERDRIHLAILYLCENSLENVSQYLSMALSDYRDVLVCAEYPESAKFEWDIKDEDQEKYQEAKRIEKQRYQEWLRASGA